MPRRSLATEKSEGGKEGLNAGALAVSPFSKLCVSPAGCAHRTAAINSRTIQQTRARVGRALLARGMAFLPLLGVSSLLLVPGLHLRGARLPLRSGGACIGMGEQQPQPPPSSPLSVSVADLGVTMDDLKAPLSDVVGVEASGCESTSRVTPDSGCIWSETASRVEASTLHMHITS